VTASDKDEPPQAKEDEEEFVEEREVLLGSFAYKCEEDIEHAEIAPAADICKCMECTFGVL
jgi:hypothetical protein